MVVVPAQAPTDSVTSRHRWISCDTSNLCFEFTPAFLVGLDTDLSASQLLVKLGQLLQEHLSLLLFSTNLEFLLLKLVWRGLSLLTGQLAFLSALRLNQQHHWHCWQHCPQHCSLHIWPGLEHLSLCENGCRAHRPVPAAGSNRSPRVTGAGGLSPRGGHHTINYSSVAVKVRL